MPHRNFFFDELSVRQFFAWLAFDMLAIVLSMSVASCGALSPMRDSAGTRITVMTWNAQTFFDAVETGTEFDEFRGGANGWNAERYGARLDRLRAVVELCGRRAGEEPGSGPDIAVLEEIENEGVVRDICNRLSQRTTYRYAAFVPPADGSAFGSAVLSRLPITGVTAHNVDPEPSGSAEPLALRPMLEVSLRLGEETLTVFAVHWKSKSGSDVAPSERARLAQERLLADRIAALEVHDALWIACGDCNQRYDEFTLLGRYVNCWDDWLEKCSSGAVDGPAGSYYYRETWETIDNVFLPGDVWTVQDFMVVAEPPIADSDLLPKRFDAFSGKGVSDHLPLVLALEKRN